MCGRYSITVKAEKLIKQFSATFESPDDYKPKYNAAPSQKLPVITAENPEIIKLYQWGLIPSWAKDKNIANKLINARGETVDEKPSFRSAFKSRRCIVLTDGYYEWIREDSKKVPYRITMNNEEPFAMAGLWESWKDENDNIIKTFTVITTEANEKLKEIHHRMPVIFTENEIDTWLNKKLTSEHAKELLRPLNSDYFKYYQVSTAVNSPRNDSPEIIENVG